MDIFFQDLNEVPLPPNEVRIREIYAEPWSDKRRVHVFLELEPFQSPPSVELLIYNERGENVAQANVVDTFTHKVELTMHLRDPNPSGRFTLKTFLYYLETQDAQDLNHEVEPQIPTVIDEKQFEFVISEPGNIRE